MSHKMKLSERLFQLVIFLSVTAHSLRGSNQPWLLWAGVDHMRNDCNDYAWGFSLRHEWLVLHLKDINLGDLCVQYVFWDIIFFLNAIHFKLYLSTILDSLYMIGLLWPFLLIRINLNPRAQISNYIHYKVWNWITNPFPNFNVKFWEWISKFIPHYTGMWLLIHAVIKVNSY